jgi:hypothetical protein
VITDIYVDVNKNGDFEAAIDLFIEMVGVTNLSLNNFAF